ncbi:hypothetical protein EBL89_06725 [Cereibacter sphaeroides]|uniref:hypothetical protein n=1 Tax=Cereibacter sphaeroides TaxID=1063 RepID=UPI000F51E5D8|nr:hypothetical protein [Cereibacter sphaeroides]AZB55019.1 hypothetical protein EBL89_06725 [Cereibacter sphaeroides]AZB59275.1 hypothetical protein EBL88_06665 [Cereibacter sphaeroides]AZB66135.1 hypothetical protein EBL87_20745 [Cereibacter sphaeroides]AZB70954.1 hypothetical protein EBL86_21705 [Cereibacter sphaeroides]
MQNHVLTFVTDAAKRPEIPAGAMRNVIVAVRRAENERKVSTIPALYLNGYPLHMEEGCEEEGCTGCGDAGDGDGCPCTGFYVEAYGGGDYDEYYEPLLRIGDELVAWAEIPVFEE